jgi:hypothetical protein
MCTLKNIFVCIFSFLIIRIEQTITRQVANYTHDIRHSDLQYPDRWVDHASGGVAMFLLIPIGDHVSVGVIPMRNQPSYATHFLSKPLLGTSLIILLQGIFPGSTEVFIKGWSPHTWTVIPYMWEAYVGGLWSQVGSGEKQEISEQ